jgi:predicted ArsR family transcriptional regulator
MDTWWGDLESEILACLKSHRAIPCADVARQLGVSEDAAASLLTMLANEHKVRLEIAVLPAD